ncbi:tetratricopeptide repeat protein [Streptomyces sp. NPDC058469]|uniref:tetratricopeptide repeat protein n=1 Tax=Streptomyces sp. NPDC058469 TaxID=3346514 RepID=UPI0036507E13
MGDVFVGRADEQNRLRLLLGQLGGVGPDEGHVVLVRGQGGVGKSTLLARMREIVGEERPRRGWRRERLTAVFLDWGENPLRSVAAASADGPEVWRLLAAVAAALEEACGAAAERAFNDFRRQASQLPEMVERAKNRMLLDEHGSAQPVITGKEAQGLLADVSGLGLAAAGIPVGQKSVEKAIAGVFTAGSVAHRLRHGTVDAQVFRQLIDAKTELVQAFGQGLRTLARRQPVVVIMDTCELLGPTLLELHQIIARSGPRTVWVLGTRLEDGEQRAEHSIAERLLRGVQHTRLHDMPLLVFDDDSAAAYLSARQPALSRQEITQAVSFSRGLPLALALIVQALKTGMHIEEICERPTDAYGLPSEVVQKLALRYLTHTATVPALADDRSKLCALALAQYNDPDVLAVLWNVPAADVRTVTDRLTARHDFMSSHHRVLHDDVRAAILNLLLRKDERAAVREVNQRAADFLRERAGRAGHQTVDEQLADDQWQRDISALVWHTFWADPRTGTTLLLQLLPWAEPVPDFRDQLIQHAQFFAPTCLPDTAATLTALRSFGDRFGWGWSAGEERERRAARRRVEAASTTVPPDVAAQPPASVYRNLWAAATAATAALPPADAVALLRTAAYHTLPPDTATARRIASVASDLTRGWRAMRGMTTAEQQDELTLHEIIVRHDPTNGDAHRVFGDCLATSGRWQEAETAYHQALHHNPTNSNAHNGLGDCLAEAGRWQDAETAYRQALHHDPTNSGAHNGLGYCHGMAGRWQDAETAIREALHHDPTNSGAHSNLGYCHSMAGRWQDAETAIREALHHHPTDSSAHSNLGLVLWLRDDTTGAESCFRSALSADARSIAAPPRLGLLLLHTGRTDEARAVLENAPAGDVRRELFLAVALHASEPARVSARLQAALAASEQPFTPRRVTTPFTRALDRAWALAATGRGTEGAAVLRAVSATRVAHEMFETPFYDQLAKVIDPAQLEPILQVWREIIAADPHACGVWGPPPPATP